MIQAGYRRVVVARKLLVDIDDTVELYVGKIANSTSTKDLSRVFKADIVVHEVVVEIAQNAGGCQNIGFGRETQMIQDAFRRTITHD